jgi:restriction endonuclease
VCALLMAPGTGKTKTVIYYMGMLWTKYGRVDALITAPLSALDTWGDEFDKHLPEGINLELHVIDEGSIEDKAAFIGNLPENTDALRVLVINHDALNRRHNVKGLKTVTVQDRIIRAITDKWCPDIYIVDESHRLKTHTSNLSRGSARIAKRTFRRILMTPSRRT